jgi:plastocyanin
MTRLFLLLAGLTLAVLSLACTEDAGSETATVGAATIPAAATVVPVATSAPVTAAAQTTAAPTSSAPPAPTQSAAAPTQPPVTQPTPPPAPSGPVTIAISAQNLAFDRASISVPRNATVTVNFTNKDVLVAHDFGVSIPFVPHTATCNGPCEASITFSSGPPGAYTFQCSTHQEMVGTFTVN